MFCHACNQSLPNETLKFCPYCGTSLEASTTDNTIIKVAKFDLTPESLFQSCIQSLNDLRITVNKMDVVAKCIETVGISKSPIGNSNTFPAILIRVSEEGNGVSILTVSIISNDVALATESFDRLISALRSRLNQESKFAEGEKLNERSEPLVNSSYSQHGKIRSDSRTIRTISIIIGILGAIWTAILLFDVLYMNSKLSQAAEIGFGLGALIVARLTPSVQISGIIGLLSIVITILLFVRPSKSRIVVLLALSIVNILLSLWVVNQMPQLLYELFVVLVLGMIFNVVSLIYSAYVYGKIDR